MSFLARSTGWKALPGPGESYSDVICGWSEATGDKVLRYGWSKGASESNDVDFANWRWLQPELGRLARQRGV
jgi:hypothetical protein